MQNSSSNAEAVAPVLTDFLDVEMLQEIQDAFTAVTRLATVITDPQGEPVTAPTDTSTRARSDALMEGLIEGEIDDDGRITAPIVMHHQVLGSIAVLPGAVAPDDAIPEERLAPLREVLDRLGLDDEQRDPLLAVAERTYASNTAASVQMLHLIASAITRLCYQAHSAQRRLRELSVLYKVSTVLSAHRDLQQVLDTACRTVAEAMEVKAASIRMLRGSGDTRSLDLQAAHNLSREYMNKGAVQVSTSGMFHDALREGHVIIEDMTADPRIVFRDEAAQEGLRSMLTAAMVFQDKPIGTLQLMTGVPRTFSGTEVELARAIANVLAAAIENARLDAQRQASQQIVRQLRLAGDVQKRMLPQRLPELTGYDLAARSVPSFELGGDFYDFIRLEGTIGLVVGDVVGHGVAASLLMASVRASLRAYAQDLYDLDEVIQRVNVALTRDTLDNEFATLWYGTLNPGLHRLTYCNAGHDPPILMRGQELSPLETGGMIVGIDREQQYEKAIIDLEIGDTLLIYTDGLADSMDLRGKRFGRERIEAALLECGDKTAPQTLDHVLWRVRQHTGPRRAHDDTTLVVLKRRNPIPATD